MKKLLTKIVLSLILIINLANTTYAANELCFDEDETCDGVPCIITIVEEPFSSKEGTKGDAYQVRTCTRVVTTTGNKSSQEVLESCPGVSEEENTTITCSEINVILSKPGTSMITGYIGSLYRWGASIGGLIAVAVIIISGVQIALSAGDSQVIDEAKGRIIKSLSGLALLFLASALLYTVNPTFFTLS
ncbi:hypothetical protein KJ632_04790 [Patescibacteria group bacterium]|nr:hypothetical protein [Patescibacteria group bacterium]